MSPTNSPKLILVIGATGAQGLAVIDKLLEPCANGNPSPYAVRALTRDPSSRRAQELASRGVECVKGLRLCTKFGDVARLNLNHRRGFR